MGHDAGRRGAPSGDTDWDAAALQEWVAHVAESEAISEREVLDRMLSALWILDEVESLWEDADGKELPDLDLDAAVRAPGRQSHELEPITGDHSADRSPASDDEPMAGVDSNTLLEVVRAVRGDESNDTADARSAARTDRVDSRLDTVVEDVAALRSRLDRIQDQVESGDADVDGDVADELEAVRARVDEFESRLDAHDDRVDAHDDRLDVTDDTVESHAETLSAFGDSICAHAERLEAAEDALDATDAQLETHAARLDDVETESASVAATQDDLQDAYERNFDNVDTALRFLVDRTDDVSGSVEQLESVLDAERRERRRRENERRRLAELRHELSAYGITRATCEGCRNEVDVSCLLRPRCPHCDRSFDGYRRRGGVMGFFATDELTTTSTGPRMQSRESALDQSHDSRSSADD